MIGLRAQAGLLFVEADSEFTFSGGPICAFSHRIERTGNQPLVLLGLLFIFV